MRSGVIAQKVGMTRVFTDGGEHVPVTVLRLANCQVVAHRTKDKNGYVAVQLGSGTRKSNNVNKADRGYFAAAKVEPKRKLAEFRVAETWLQLAQAERAGKTAHDLGALEAAYHHEMQTYKAAHVQAHGD